MKNSYILLRFRPKHFHRFVVHATAHLSVDDERHHHAYTAHDDRHQSHARRFAIVEIFHPFVHEQRRREVGQHATRHDIKQIRPELRPENIPETRAHHPADGHAPPTQTQGVEQHGEHTGERNQHAEHRQGRKQTGVISLFLVAVCHISLQRHQVNLILGYVEPPQHAAYGSLCVLASSRRVFDIHRIVFHETAFVTVGDTDPHQWPFFFVEIAQAHIHDAFHFQLSGPPARPLHPVNPDNACSLRITAAAGT